MNFIQYIDDSYSVKTRSVTVGEAGYSVSGIDTPFFILSLYVGSIRQNGVVFNNYDSIEMLSVINDMANVDLNVIPLNYFAPAYTEIQLYVPYSVLKFNIDNFVDFQVKPLRYLKEYKLPQLRHDNRFGYQAGYQYDSRLYSLLHLGTLQYETSFYIEKHHAYKNSIDLDNPLYAGQIPSNLGDAYQNQDSTNILVNGSILQYGDFFVKINKISGTYPYGFGFYLWTDIRTNEIWPYIYYLDAQSQNRKAEFDLSTLVCVSGGFKIKNILYDVEITISTIYG